MAAIIPQNEIWREFFLQYRSLPELWNPNLASYKEKHKRNQALSKLLETYRLIDGNANEDTLKRRIRNMRSCFQREVKKVEDRRKSGREDYVPNLWYYDLLDFLIDENFEVGEEGEVVRGDEEEGDRNGTPEYVLPHVVATLRTSTSPPSKRSKPNERNKKETPHPFTLGQRKPGQARERDYVDAFAASWAASFRRLNPEQKIFAKKAIEDVLVLGQLEKLTLNTVAFDYNAEHSNAEEHTEEHAEESTAEYQSYQNY